MRFISHYSVSCEREENNYKPITLKPRHDKMSPFVLMSDDPVIRLSNVMYVMNNMCGVYYIICLIVMCDVCSVVYIT